jgi:hypothetical protein
MKIFIEGDKIEKDNMLDGKSK